MALQFAMVAMGAALRGTGNFKPGMIVATATVILNMVLAPFLIFGWVTGVPLGVAGAAISSLVAVVVGRGLALDLLHQAERLPAASCRRSGCRSSRSGARCSRSACRRAPSSADGASTCSSSTSISRPFGAAAQAGFGIGLRIVQAGFMPVVALGFSVAPVAGQNFGARLADRVKKTFVTAGAMAAGIMAVLGGRLPLRRRRRWCASSATTRRSSRSATSTCASSPGRSSGSGLVFVSSSMFQALGNTLPAAGGVVRTHRC